MKSMKFIFVLTLALVSSAKAANYYFSTAMGNDTRTPIQAQNPATPWKTLNKLNSFMVNLLPGDSILFNRGETFYGSIIVTTSGASNLPIVFSAYGSGAKPIISGLTALTGWVNKGGGIWESPCPSCGSTLNMVLLDGVQQEMGRYPNINAPNKGYLNFESHVGKKQITDSQLVAIPNWTGGEVVIRTNHWILDRLTISNHTGMTITSSFTDSTAYPLTDHYGYFIQNHSATLDKLGEWYFNVGTGAGTQKVSMYFGTNSPSLSTIDVSTVDTLVNVTSRNNIVFNNLTFKGSNKNGFILQNDFNCVINSCDFLFMGFDAITGGSNNNTDLTNNFFSSVNNNAIFSGFQFNHSRIKGNTLKKIALFPGMGGSGEFNYQGVFVMGTNIAIENNVLDSMGYTSLYFGGDTTLIKNNVVSNFALIKDDVGGIETWTGAPAPTSTVDPAFKARKIVSNIVINGIGAPEGTDDLTVRQANGIYLDDNSANVETSNNTVAHCTQSGIYLHNDHITNTRSNTFFNNGSQLIMGHQDLTCHNCSMINNTLRNNIFFAKTARQLTASFEADANDIAGFGTLDSNYYCRPLADDYDINIVPNSIISTAEDVYDLQGWQAKYLKDPASKKSPFTIPSYSITNFVGANVFGNETFTSNISGVSCSLIANCNTTWDNTGILDGGCLQVIPSATSTSSLMMNVGAVSSTKNYILKFSLRGTKNNKKVGAYLGQSSGVNTLTPIKYFKINNSRGEYEILFSQPTTESNASIVFNIDGQDSTMWLDNVQLLEANVNITNPDNYIRFEYNPTQAVKTFSLSGTWYDVKNTSYSGNVSLNPFTSIILMKNTATNITNISKEDKKMTIYPNPASNLLNVILDDNDIQKIKIEVYDVLGHLVTKEATISKSENKFQIDVSDFKAGMYFLKVSANQSVYQKMFSKTE